MTKAKIKELDKLRKTNNIDGQSNVNKKYQSQYDALSVEDKIIYDKHIEEEEYRQIERSNNANEILFNIICIMLVGIILMFYFLFS